MKKKKFNRSHFFTGRSEFHASCEQMGNEQLLIELARMVFEADNAKGDCERYERRKNATHDGLVYRMDKHYYFESRRRIAAAVALMRFGLLSSPK